MSFALRSLSVLAYANGFTLWHYRSDDALLAVGRSGYFDDAVDMMAGGDMVMVSAQDGGRVLRVQSEDGRVTAQPLA